MIWGLVWRIVTSRAGIVVLIGLALFTWHTFDKGSAVRRAVSGYVAKVELETLRAELDELRRRRAAVRLANQDLQTKVQEAEAEADAAVQELERYETTVHESCLVDGSHLKRLRNR
jgi:chromosome segregation ATPase